jgi:hypothetical protein
MVSTFTAGAPGWRIAKWGAGLVIAQAVVSIAIGVLTTTVYPQSHEPGTAAFNSWGAVLTAMHVLLLLGVATLVTTRAAGRGALATAAYVLVLAGLALQATAEAVLRFSFSAGNTLFGIVVPGIAVAMLLLGVAIWRARTWRGWTRLVPFACGAYIPLVLLPAFGASHGVNFLAIAGWQVLFLILGIAMWDEAGQISRRAKLQRATPSTATTQNAHQAS